MFFSKNRRDGIYLKDLAPFKKFLPWIMPGINQSAIYYRMQVDLTKTLLFIQAANEKGVRLTLFQVLIAALLRTGVEIPELNRFVSGHRIFERREHSAAYTMKAGEEDATARVRLDPGDPLAVVSEKILATTRKARQEASGGGRTIFDTLEHVPRWVLRRVMRLWSWLDYYDLLPKFIREMTPMYSSVYVANLASYDIDAPFHHLFDYGNVSLFVTLGHVHQAPVATGDSRLEVRPVVNLGLTLDERIVSGSTSSRALKRLKEVMEDPAYLENPPDLPGSRIN